MFTAAAARSLEPDLTVAGLSDLARLGWTPDAVRSQVRARRWQRIGRAIVLHNAVPTVLELRRIALINAGPHAVTTSFTALAQWGLTGWERDAVHVLVPRGARVVRPIGVPVRIHWTDRWPTREISRVRRQHGSSQSAVLAATSFTSPRSACGVLAAVVQQRLVRPEQIVDAVEESTRIRHRAVLLAAAHDIGQGTQALSEIDFARLCRRAGLPEPSRQAVRVERSGRRRYLDVDWTLPDGRRLVAEVDGALHLTASRWWSDQLRQNELVLSGDRVLRFPSVVLRCEEQLVVDQLRRGLFLP